MLEQSRDPTTIIIDRAPGMVEYLSISGERWRIYGTCNRCGACEIGGIDPEISFIGYVGEANACINIAGQNRLDVPVRPEISEIPTCTLTGEYI